MTKIKPIVFFYIKERKKTSGLFFYRRQRIRSKSTDARLFRNQIITRKPKQNTRKV